MEPCGGDVCSTYKSIFLGRNLFGRLHSHLFRRDHFTFDKTINNVEYRIVYSGSALDTNHPVIDRISVTDKQSNAELAFIRRYNYEVGSGIEADPGITRSVEELQSGGFASFEHLMKSGGMTCEQFGSDQADIMIGFTSDLENLWGMDGDDTLIGGVGEELLWGEDGFDYASYETASGGVLVSLNGNPALNTGVAYWDRFYSIEGLIGSAQDDHLIGDSMKNHLRPVDIQTTSGIPAAFEI
jgi:hypothetical protein